MRSLDDQLLAIISDDAIQSVISRRCKKQKINTKRVLVRCFKRVLEVNDLLYTLDKL